MRSLNATVHYGTRLVIDVQGFDYDRSQHSDGTTLLVKDVTADDLRELAAQLLEQAETID